MYKSLFTFLLLAMVMLQSGQSLAAPEAFNKGPIIADYGENATVPDGLQDAQQQSFKVAFDVAQAQQGEQANRGFNSIARFINMHARAGVPVNKVNAALVVHGKASLELLSEQAYQSRFGKSNPSHDLLKQLLAAGVRIELCGQSAAYSGIEAEQLMKGVHLSLSAMTAHALLQQQGYTLNPF